MPQNQSFLEFHINLMGYNIYLKNKIIPKFLLYHNGIDADKLLLNKTKYNIKERK